MRTEIIYEDNAVLVGYKPAGLATETARVGQTDMVSELKNYLASGQKSGGKSPYLGVIHRLDQPVEGLLVFAKDRRAAATLSAQLRTGTLGKRYCAVICGQPACEQGELADDLRRGGDGRAYVVTGQQERYPDARRAVLHYEIVREINAGAGPECPAGPKIFLADIRIGTGRFHQIRAQMAHAGMPLLGDRKYGTEESLALSCRLGMRNVALYACHLEFVHPVTEELLSFHREPDNLFFA